MTTLDPNDLNFENRRSFDGTTVYAQNKVLPLLTLWREGTLTVLRLFANEHGSLLFVDHLFYFASWSIYTKV